MASPALSTVATPVAEEDHVAELVSRVVVPSVSVPVAENCWVRPAATDGVAGVTLIEASTGAVTVSMAVPLTLPDAAVIVVVPWTLLVAKPLALTIAVAVLEDFQVAEPVKSFVVPSE